VACLERADEGERFIGRLNQLLRRSDQRSNENIELLCALLGSPAGSKLARDGGGPLAAVWRFAKELYVLRAELRFRAFARTGVGLDRSAAETGKKENRYFRLLQMLKDTTSKSTVRSTLEAIVAGAHEAGFALPGLQPACKPRRHYGSGLAIPADLADGGTRARWIRAASAELPCGLTRAAAGWTACRTGKYKRIGTDRHVRPCSRAHVVGGRSQRWARSAVRAVWCMRRSYRCIAWLQPEGSCGKGPGCAVAAKARLPGRVQ
jgi:hypothetical protein